ncbi:hypothetical protein ABTY53_12865 [Streptomyces noursei]
MAHPVAQGFAQMLTEDATVGHAERTEELLRRDPRMIGHPSAPAHP